MSLAPTAGLQGLPAETVPIILPSPAQVFEKRSARLRSLAPGHAVSAYLDAMARLAEAQLAAANVKPSGSEEAFVPALPFDVHDHCHNKAWQKGLEAIVSEMRLTHLPEPSQAALARLSAASPAALDAMAQEILSRNYDRIDLAAAPFIAAALQAYWTNLASNVQAEAAERITRNCPVCASPPVAGVILSGRKLRYLCCSLCATQWYMPRLTCATCGSTAGISYFALDGDTDGTKAEACSQCNAYLKLFYLESNRKAEAFADDLATLALDLLMSGRGYSRLGINLFLLPAPC